MKLHFLAGVSLLALAMSCTSNKHTTAKTVKKADGTPINVVLKYQAPVIKGKRAPASLPEGLTPNSVKYADRGAKPETGRSGIYQVQTRAYLNKAGKTTLEVTSGDFETGALAGTHLTKIQLKGFNTAGEEVFTNNFNGLTNNGTWSQEREDMGRRQKFQIFSHLSKDGIKRNFVVTNESVVYILPDLKADKIVAQAQAYDHEPITITGEVLELNGDLGARGDCVLSIDGSEVARTAGIWVDASDRVSCTFNRQFDTVGTHTIKFTVENVNPADYDSTNNSVEKTINVVSHETLLTNNYVYFEDMTYSVDYAYRYALVDYSGSYHMDNIQQYISYNGEVADLISGGGEFRVYETSGANSLTWSGTVPGTDLCQGNSYWSCYQAYDYNTNRYLTINKAKTNNHSYVYYQRHGGRVVYHGIGGYAYLDQYNQEWGPRLPLVGYEYNIEVSVSSGTSNFVGRASPTLHDYNYNYDSHGDHCWNTGSYYGEYCESYRYNYVGKRSY
ncbi:MAG: hypothetical protein A2X86_18595 [Bdellovibrionales bacterium GWA2_49_15]|nr:MAG: hypothetical protein A2X86_18595 [Bdellovibrionales bacterium GWA2_49_15]HAZ11534.1 hypothetical protein [Bdellovibrionales bacterium]